MLFLDTEKLSLHIDDILEEKKTAQNLFDMIQSIKQLTYSKYDVDRSLVLKFQRLIEKSDDLVNYYSKLSAALDRTTFDAVKMIAQTNQLLSDHSDMTKRLTNQTINIETEE
jgi:hypothetical protein